MKSFHAFKHTVFFKENFNDEFHNFKTEMFSSSPKLCKTDKARVVYVL